MTYSRPYAAETTSGFKLFHELMIRKVYDILLVSTPYDAWIMEEDGQLSARIVNEYRGLNLSRPPKVSWVATAEEALESLRRKRFDLVITMPRLPDMDAYRLGLAIKEEDPDLPVVMLSHSLGREVVPWRNGLRPPGVDRSFVWSGNADILLALVKSIEDRWNAEHDTEVAGIRIILFVEDSPIHLSALLPLLYRELVEQTRAVLGRKLNEEHRLLTMRARPKILVAENYEEATALFHQFEPYVLGVISDVQFPCNGQLDRDAGIRFLNMIRQERFDIPVLLTSMDPENAERAATIPAAFVHKASPTLHEEIHTYFKHSLAFDDFIFRLPDGTEVGKAADLRELEQCIAEVPGDSLLYHGKRNDFSRWLFTRTEAVLGARVRDIHVNDFSHADELRRALIALINARRRERQQGVIVSFDATEVDLVNDFLKIGQGSLGGKARSLAFIAAMLARDTGLREFHPDVDIFVPQTLVISTDIFQEFVERNELKYLAEIDVSDRDVATRFLAGTFPKSLENDLRAYLAEIRYPLAVRSSSLLEDAQFRAYAGLYKTYMLPNEHDNIETRLWLLLRAVKLVYASTYYQGPKAFSRRVGRRTEEEQMAVLVQRLIGQRYGPIFYPTLSGVAQSFNYYPFGRLKPEDGIVNVAMGLGRAVVEGEKTLRFSPKHPQVVPERSSVDGTLENAQRYFYALRMGEDGTYLDISDLANLQRLEVTQAEGDHPLRLLASTYVRDEHRIRDTSMIPGERVITFASILKYGQFPLTDLMTEAMRLGQTGMGTPVEIEFSVDFPPHADMVPEFAFLQLRPMTARVDRADFDITDEEISRAFCYSSQALGNTYHRQFADIIYVKPAAFEPEQTRVIAAEVGRLNALLMQESRRYLLVGPGRWGTADPWMGIPVAWTDISGVGAIVETYHTRLWAEPSQGSHFFYNITTLGINYISVARNEVDFFDWEWLLRQPIAAELPYTAHVRLPQAMTLKVDGRSSRSVIIAGDAADGPTGLEP